MNIRVLDCTLRDGGYCNNWDFGNENVKYIIDKLVEAKLDIIEIGFLSDKKVETENNSIFRSVEKINKVIPYEKNNSEFVCMCNYGEIDFNKIEDSSVTRIDGIRVAFHKKDWKDALVQSEIVKLKGYKVYLQPMVTMSYSDKELIELIEKANQMCPEAFYIVDSFGSVKREDMLRMYYLINNTLNKEIKIGFHSHNNMQLSYANSQRFVEIYDDRDKIIDASVFGMGRGAGNLNTELFVEYLNNCHEKEYVIYPLLQTIDNVLNKIYLEQYWGYSLPHYLSAKYNCHPNYATYLSNKNTLNIAAINEVLSRISEEEKVNYSKDLIERIYVDYQSEEYVETNELTRLKGILEEAPIVILAPGASLKSDSTLVIQKIKELKAKIICVNFVAQEIKPDFVFVSNKKRFEQFEKVFDELSQGLIYTSNIHIENSAEKYCVNYKSVRNDTVGVEDNSTLMLLQLINNMGIRKVYIAGFDGYSSYMNNYFDANLITNLEREQMDIINEGIKIQLMKMSHCLELEFITPSMFFAREGK